MEKQEDAYLYLRSRAMTPESARGVLPNDMSVRVIVKANLREWRHFFDLRCAPAAYPQMRELALEMLRLAHSSCPCVFEDLFLKYNAEALQGEDRDGD